MSGHTPWKDLKHKGKFKPGDRVRTCFESGETRLSGEVLELRALVRWDSGGDENVSLGRLEHAPAPPTQEELVDVLAETYAALHEGNRDQWRIAHDNAGKMLGRVGYWKRYM